MTVTFALTEPPVLLLHAFPCASRMWQPQVEALEGAGRRVLACDLPGFAGTPLPSGSPSLDAVADDVIAHVDAQGIGVVDVAGVSLGGYVALNLIRRHPGRLRSVALCDTKASADSLEARGNRERLARLCEAAPDDTARVLEQAVLPGLLGATSFARRPEVVSTVRGWLGEAPAATVAWYQRAMAERPDSLATLANVDLPRLVLWGDEDTLSPEAEQRLMIEASVQSTAVCVPDAGHLANVEVPERVSEALLAFLGTVR